MTKVIAISGSAKKDSNTKKMLDLFLEGLAPTADVKIYYPSRMKLKFCTGCLGCWFKTPGQCVIDDDMRTLLPEINMADVIIIASPLYIDGFSAQVKVVMDRCASLLEAFIFIDEYGHCRHRRTNQKEQKAVLISTCGFSEKDNFVPISASFAAACRTLGWQNVGEVTVPASGLMSVKGAYDEKYAAVRKAGVELARDGIISTETMELISRELVDARTYQSGVNKVFGKLLGEKG